MIIIEIIIRLVVVFFDPAGFPSKQNKISSYKINYILGISGLKNVYH